MTNAVEALGDSGCERRVAGNLAAVLPASHRPVADDICEHLPIGGPKIGGASNLVGCSRRRLPLQRGGVRDGIDVCHRQERSRQWNDHHPVEIGVAILAAVVEIVQESEADGVRARRERQREFVAGHVGAGEEPVGFAGAIHGDCHLWQDVGHSRAAGDDFKRITSASGDANAGFHAAIAVESNNAAGDGEIPRSHIHVGHGFSLNAQPGRLPERAAQSREQSAAKARGFRAVQGFGVPADFVEQHQAEAAALHGHGTRAG